MYFFNNLAELEGFIDRMIDKLDSSRTDNIELTVSDVSLRLSRGGGHCPPPHGNFESMREPHSSEPTPERQASPNIEPPAARSEDVHTVNAPLLGVAYAAPAPDAAPFVRVGQQIKRGDVICIVEAMKIMNEIESDRDGVVTDIFFTNGKMVEFGQPLIAVK